jgi:hypothetical protein
MLENILYSYQCLTKYCSDVLKCFKIHHLPTYVTQLTITVTHSLTFFCKTDKVERNGPGN